MGREKRSRRGPPRWISALAGKVDTPEVADAIEKGVDELWASDMPGREKKRELIKTLARTLAKSINFATTVPPPWGLMLEAVDYQLFRLLLGLPVQLAYRARQKREEKPKPKARRKVKAKKPTPEKAPDAAEGGD